MTTTHRYNVADTHPDREFQLVRGLNSFKESLTIVHRLTMFFYFSLPKIHPTSIVDEDSSHIYILRAIGFNKYHTGYSTHPIRRVSEHNVKPFNTYSSKYRPWELKACFYCGTGKTARLYHLQISQRMPRQCL